ncbi:L-threonylcarbamoyladenylate synthase [Deinococcus sonorensis]|uniref:L-threonylcarbamoyladenylate synthase n=2 Tax=Deinococcus sonorensis TaxID=309891 RepID=A0AAU7U8I7_9DEIO
MIQIQTSAQDALTAALQALQAGQVVGYPSETVWGLAVLPGHPEALERLYQRKGRDPLKPVQLSCQDAELAREWVAPDQPLFERLTAWWPGPLTLLARARPGCPPDLAPDGVVGLRVPDHPLAQALLQAAGGVLVTTSLNPSGAPPAVRAAQAQQYGLADLLFGIEDDVGTVAGLASTVIDTRSGVVVRRGSLLPPLPELR